MSGSSPLAGLGSADVIRHLPVAALVVESPSGRIVHANARAREMVERQLGRRIPSKLTSDWEIFYPDGRPYRIEDWPLVRSITSGEEVVDEEYFNLLADGRRLTVRCSSAPIYDNGEIVGGLLVMDDITERKRAEEERAYHALLVDNVEDAVVGTDPQFRLTVWNKGAERLYGFTADEVVGRDAREVGTYEDDVSRLELERELVETDRTRAEITAYRKDGTRVEVELVSVAVRDAQGQVIGYLGIHRDVTERKRAEEALRAANRRTEGVLEGITDDFIVFDAQWRYTYVNEGALNAINTARGALLTREEVIGKKVWDLFPDFARTALYRELEQARREDRAVRVESYSEPDDRWVEVHAYSWEGGLSTYTRDITARRRADEQLAYHARLLENMHDAVLATDDQFVLTAWNRGAEAMFGWTAAEALGRKVYELIPTQFSDDQLAQELRDLAETGAWRGEAIWYAKGGAPVLAEGRTIALQAADGSTTGYLCIMRDISERRRSARELERRARQQAVIARLGVKALEGEDLQSLMDQAVTLVCRTLEVDYAEVDELLPGGEELLMSAGAGWREGIVGSQRMPARRGSEAGYTLLTGEPVIVDDMTAETRFEVPPVVRDHEVMSAAIVVVAPRGKPFGTLAALSKQRRSFSDDDIHFLQATANVIATAVEREDGEKTLERVREAERSRIARDLHDEALRDLTHAVAETDRAQTAAPESDTNELLGRLGSALRRVVQQLRAAIYDLRLAEEEHRPFPELLQSLIAVHRTMALDCDIQLDVRDGAIGSLGQRGTQLLRIVGEALTNARCHSGASTIRVALWNPPDQLVVEVSDDGNGFDPASEQARIPATGIRGMHERAEILNGELKIDSRPGSGSSVRVELPLTQPGSESARPVRVLLVEDHAAVRQAIARAFDQEDDFEVVAQAGSLAEARQLLGDVDVAVIDLGLPDGYGGDLVGDLREAKPDAQTLVLSASLDRAQIARAVQSGAAAVLNKTAPLEEVVTSVRRLRAGETLLPLNDVVELLRFADRRREQEHDDRQAIALLTPREREVLQALADGLNSQQIADQLHITVRTERNHVANILAKLDIHSRLQALVFALRYGVVEIR
jgi:PAS domain S-box-containing protein